MLGLVRVDRAIRLRIVLVVFVSSLHFGLPNPFGYKGLDTKSLAMGRLGISWRDTSKENLESLLALPPQDPAQIHRADYDARYQALILQALLDRSA